MEFLPSTNDLVFLTVVYCLAYAGGLLISKLWMWLRIIVLVLIMQQVFSGFDLQEMNYKVFLVIIVPSIILLYLPVKKTFALNLRFSNPFAWIFDKINELRYLRQRAKEREREQERFEQAEEAERQRQEERQKQRQYEREQERAEQERAGRKRAESDRAEREARERAERDARERARAEQEARERAKTNNRQRGQHDSHQGRRNNSYQERQRQHEAKADTNKDPYEVLGVSRSASFEELQKAYRDLANKYHPDKVSHLAPEFQAMANEKLKEINAAWGKVKRERG